MSEKPPAIENSIEDRPPTDVERIHIASKFNLPLDASWEELEKFVGDARWILIMRAGLYPYTTKKEWKKYEALLEKLKEGKESFDSTEGVKLIEEILGKYEEPENSHSAESLIEMLNSINSAEEAQASEIRKSAQIDNRNVLSRLHFLRDYCNLTTETYNELHGRWKRLNKAIGAIVHGTFTHDC